MEYWRLAKMAFILGAASAAGTIVVNTMYKLAKRTGETLVDDHEEPLHDDQIPQPENIVAEPVEPEKA